MTKGKALLGALSATVTNNNYYQADHFSAEFAINAAASGWWDIDPPLIIDIRFSVDAGQSWTSEIVGEVDHLTVNLQTGSLTMEGRDLSARMIEAKTQETFVNKTASEVAQIIADRHKPDITGTNINATTTLVGRYYEADHAKITLDQFSRTTTEWDLLVYLAQREGYDVYMTGTILNFQPGTPPDSTPFVLTWTPPQPIPRFNAMTLRMERSLTIAKDVQVTVRSWNSQQGRGFTKTAKAIGGKAASAASGTKKANTTQNYIFVRPNLDEASAQALANQLAHEITLHERVISVEMPGEPILTPRMMVKLAGTGTSFDQTYYVSSIDRSISFDGGFTQSVRLKNSSPRTQTQVG